MVLLLQNSKKEPPKPLKIGKFLIFDGYIPLNFWSQGCLMQTKGRVFSEDPIREKNWDVKKRKKKNRGRFMPLPCPPWRKEVHYGSALLILLAVADTQWGTDAAQSRRGRRAARAQACYRAPPYIFLSPFFPCSASVPGAPLCSELWGTSPSMPSTAERRQAADPSAAVQYSESG